LFNLGAVFRETGGNGLDGESPDIIELVLSE
jgi:hypothetical protein